MALKDICGVEIFATGTWNGDEYSDSDLDEMVHAFNSTKATIKPALKLGHDDNQALLQKDGYPAAGWIANLRRQGSKLIADFVDMPEKIYELIKNKAYRKVSSEIYWNIDIAGNQYKRMLSAVALLGQEMPAVSTLSDIMGLYHVKFSDTMGGCAKNPKEITLKQYSLELDAVKEQSMPTENEIKLEYSLKEEKEKLAALAKEKDDTDAALIARDKEIEDLKKFKADAEAKSVEDAKKLKESEIENTVVTFEKDGLIVPAMKEYVKALLGDEKKEYAFGEKKLSKSEMIKEMLKIHSVANGMNMESGTEEGKKDSKTADAINAKIEKYAADNKISYAQAYKAVMKEEKR